MAILPLALSQVSLYTVSSHLTFKPKELRCFSIILFAQNVILCSEGSRDGGGEFFTPAFRKLQFKEVKQMHI